MENVGGARNVTGLSRKFMLSVGSYVWHHTRTNPVEITSLFRDCDVILLQRFPERYKSYFGHCHFFENWQQHGMLVKGGNNIDCYTLQNNPATHSISQGRVIPTLRLPNLNIISCLTSYDIPNQNNQLHQVMELFDSQDNPSVIVGDMHWEDQYINNLYEKYQLINHIKEPTFTGRRGEKLSLDKILTAQDVVISDIRIHSELASNNIEHYPLEFTIDVK